MYYMGFTYREAYLLPVWQRMWFINRTKEEINRTSGDGNTNSRGISENAPDVRSARNFDRASPPARLRRFS
jgi:hypothetical protein